MLHLTAQTEILLATAPVDFRKHVDGLVSLCENHLGLAPRSGALFVFINRSRTMIRVLCYESNGYWLATKRLSRGRFTGWPSHAGEVCKMAASDLKRLVSTVLPTKAKSVILQ